MHLKNIHSILTLMAFALLVMALAACQSAAPVAPTATVAAPVLEDYPVGTPNVTTGEEAPAPPAADGDYPAGEGEVTNGATEQEVQPPAGDNSYPGPETGADPGPGPAGAPAVENRSQILAELIEMAPAPDDPDTVRLRVRLVDSSTVDNMPEFTSQMVGQEVELFVPAAGLPQLNPGDDIQAEVSYMGDESGGRFFTQEVTKIN